MAEFRPGGVEFMPLSHNESRPDVSLVIPVFNKLDRTRGCIESILSHGAQAAFEIIVVDDGSDDGTRQWLEGQTRTGKLKAIINRENLGYHRSCNLGAELAEGRHLLFLNGRTKVSAHWLDPMVTTLDNDPFVGITGARLLYPDETIAHAGMVLTNQGTASSPVLSAVSLSLGLPALTPGAARPLDLQVVTSDCLMVRQDVFAGLGGFRANSNFEQQDADLCLRAADAGWKVVYRPESRVTLFKTKSDDCSEPGTHGVRAYTERRLHRTPAGSDPTSVSVIVLTWNALEYTRLCAESLLEHTDPRHELIFVDNGSRPDTIEYLENLEKKHSRVKVILNGENLGFAAGNNIGLAAATGRHACLLNSDTVVTGGWLENMLVHLENNPRAGLVGPVTNSITGGQKLEKVAYNEETCEGLEGFASELTASLAGQCMESLWVVGFCVLIRDQLIERLGGLDESFGQGNYEDTDYCLRAFVGGYQSLIAADSYVHHFGSRSFVDGKVDYAAELTAKHEIFRNKWNLPDSGQQNCTVNPMALKGLGFIPALHYHPLPGVPTITLWDWEKENWIRRGEAFFQAGRLDEAQRIFRRILDLCPGNTRAANNLACARWQTGDTQEAMPEAVRILEDVLKQDPDNEDARWNLEEMRPALAEL
jgi:GT2 family glycosyltransferase